MKRILMMIGYTIIGICLLCGLIFRADYHHQRAQDPIRIIKALNVKLPRIADVRRIEVDNPDSTKWDSYGYQIHFVGPFNTVITDPLEKKCDRWWSKWYRKVYQNVVDYVYPSTRRHNPYLYFCAIHIVVDIPDDSYDTAMIEYYVNKNEAKIARTGYLFMLLLLLISFFRYIKVIIYD